MSLQSDVVLSITVYRELSRATNADIYKQLEKGIKKDYAKNRHNRRNGWGTDMARRNVSRKIVKRTTGK